MLALHAPPRTHPYTWFAAVHRVAQPQPWACFFENQDRLAYLGWLREALARERCRMHVDVLMTQRVHLLLTPEQAERVPQVLISVGRRDVQYVNHIDGRTGALWDGRYKASLVQAEKDLLLCLR